MNLDTAWQIIKGAFETSPYLAAVVALVLWLAFCWKFRLVGIGLRRSLPNMLLEAFTVEVTEETASTLKVLNGHIVTHKKPQNPAEATELPSDTDQAHANWQLGEVFQIYWALIARGLIVRYTTLLITFSGISLLIMYLAKPKESVSLENVTNMIGIGSFLPLAILGLLSLLLVLCSAHQLPCKGISDEKPQNVIFFAW